MVIGHTCKESSINPHSANLKVPTLDIQMKRSTLTISKQKFFCCISTFRIFAVSYIFIIKVAKVELSVKS